MSEDAVAPLVKLLEDIQARLVNLEKAAGVTPPPSSSGGGASAAPAAVAANVTAYAAFVAESLTPLTSGLKAMGEEGTALAGFLDGGFGDWSSRFLTMVSQNKKPKDMDALSSWTDELKKLMNDAGRFRDNRSPYKNHMNAVSESIQALNWCFVEPTPVPLVQDYIDGTLFWSNKVLMEHKRKGDEGKPHVDFANNLKGMLTALKAYVKEHHTTGAAWNNRSGGTNYGPAAAAAAAAPAAAPAPAPAAKKPAAAAGGGGGGLADVFASLKKIDQSSGKTAGLRHVKREEMTHKNTALRAGTTVKAKAPVVKKAAPMKKPPSLTCARNRWMCEYQVDTCEVEVESSRQELYVFGCVGATIIVKGKVKTVTVDNCKKTAIVMESAISACEVVNCKSMKVQITGMVPSIAIDKTDGIALYLSKEGAGAMITTSKSSEMNVSVPKGDDDWSEMPIPEQFVSKIDMSTGKMSTEVSDLYSS